MQAAFLKAPFQVEFRDLPKPTPDHGEVLLKIKRVGICGADVLDARAWATDWQRFGHETVGEVVELGPGVSTLKVGDMVAVQATVPCMVCENCRNGMPFYCLDWKKSRRLEAFAEYMPVTERHAWKVTGVTPEAAVLIEPMGVSIDVVRLAAIELWDTVVLVGPGPIGVMAIRLAKLRGARRVFVVGTDLDKPRFPLCRALGANECISTNEADPVKAIRELTGGRGVHKVLNTATAPSVVQSLGMCADGGIVVFVGFSVQSSDALVSIDMNEFHYRRLQLRASYAAPGIEFPLAHQLLVDGEFPVDRIVTHRFPFPELERALRVTAEHRDGVVKAVVDVTP